MYGVKIEIACDTGTQVLNVYRADPKYDVDVNAQWEHTYNSLTNVG